MKNTTYNLTTNELAFINTHLNNNGCGAETAESLLGDNYSCLSMEDYREIMPNLKDSQIGGYLSSLEDKGVLWRDDDGLSRGVPILWWADEDYLESLNPTENFSDTVKF